MKIDPRILKQMLDLLKDGTSDGLSVAESLSLPSGLHMSSTSLEAIQARAISPTKAKLLELVDQVLPSFDLTQRGREHIRDEVSIYFNMGLEPEMVLSPLTDVQKALESMSPDLYERESFVLVAQVMSGSMIRDEVAPFYIDWGHQIIQRYGPHEGVQGYVDGFRRILDKSAK